MPVTVIMLNWARPDNVQRLLADYQRMDAVASIVVVNNNPANNYTPPEGCSKLVRVDASADLGLYSRFAAAALAKTPAVLIVDDDIVLPQTTVNELVRLWETDPSRIYGIFGRRFNRETCAYSPSNALGDVPVVLTRAAITTPEMCARALVHGVSILRECPGEPPGNGEDIVLSATAMASSGKPNHAILLPFANLNYNDVNAISVRFKQHKEHRSAVLRWCLSRVCPSFG